MAATVRTPDHIIDALARGRGLVTPVPPYFPLGVSFTREAVVEAYRDVVDVLADAARRHAGDPEVAATLKAILDHVADALSGK